MNSTNFDLSIFPFKYRGMLLKNINNALTDEVFIKEAIVGVGDLAEQNRVPVFLNILNMLNTYVTPEKAFQASRLGSEKNIQKVIERNFPFCNNNVEKMKKALKKYSTIFSGRKEEIRKANLRIHKSSLLA